MAVIKKVVAMSGEEYAKLKEKAEAYEQLVEDLGLEETTTEETTTEGETPQEGEV